MDVSCSHVFVAGSPQQQELMLDGMHAQTMQAGLWLPSSQLCAGHSVKPLRHKERSGTHMLVDVPDQCLTHAALLAQRADGCKCC